MSKYALYAMMLGGLLGGGLIGGCGEDVESGGGNGSPLPSEGEGQGEGEGPTGEGEGDTGEGEGNRGEGEGEGPLPHGADGEPCGGASKNECQDGYECLTCEEAGVGSLASGESCDGKVCTCPQWFEGRWWAEFEPRAVDYDQYDFSTAGRPWWDEQEIAIAQKGCAIRGPDEDTVLFDDPGYTDGNVSPPPNGFYYKNPAPWSEGNHWIIFQGNLSADHQKITGTCDGEWLHRAPEPDVAFRITCTFALTRR